MCAHTFPIAPSPAMEPGIKFDRIAKNSYMFHGLACILSKNEEESPSKKTLMGRHHHWLYWSPFTVKFSSQARQSAPYLAPQHSADGSMVAHLLPHRHHHPQLLHYHPGHHLHQFLQRTRTVQQLCRVWASNILMVFGVSAGTAQCVHVCVYLCVCVRTCERACVCSMQSGVARMIVLACSPSTQIPFLQRTSPPLQTSFIWIVLSTFDVKPAVLVTWMKEPAWAICVYKIMKNFWTIEYIEDWEMKRWSHSQLLLVFLQFQSVTAGHAHLRLHLLTPYTLASEYWTACHSSIRFNHTAYCPRQHTSCTYFTSC